MVDEDGEANFLGATGLSQSIHARAAAKQTETSLGHLRLRWLNAWMVGRPGNSPTAAPGHPSEGKSPGLLDGTAPSGKLNPPAESLGLDRLIHRLVVEDGFDCPADAEAAIYDYAGFFRNLAFGGTAVSVPTQRVDLVWQRHLLDTESYFRDCAQWAGNYIHRRVDFSGTPLAVPSSEDITWKGPNGSLAQEDFELLINRVRGSLAQKPVAAPWIEEGQALLEQDPALVVREYRRFLELVIAGAGPMTPSKLVDELWHQHILLSEDYCSFCDRVAGRYLHHRPHYGQSHQFHRPGFSKTRSRYLKQFGTEPDPRVWGHLGESASCGSAEPGPLYKVDSRTRMTAVLKCGNVDKRHFTSIHSVLLERGLCPDAWRGFLHDVDGLGKLPWQKAWSKEFHKDRSAFWQRVLGTAFFAVAAVFLFSSLAENGGVQPFWFGLVLSIAAAGASIWFMVHTAPDQEAVRRVLSAHESSFRELGIQLKQAGESTIELSASIRE